MSPDCNSPRCHESMQLKLSEKATKDDMKAVKACTENKVSKKAVWAIIPILFVAGGIIVATFDFKYAQVSDVAECKEQQAHTNMAVEHINKDLKEIKELVRTNAQRQEKAREDSQKDIKEILRNLRDR